MKLFSTPLLVLCLAIPFLGFGQDEGDEYLEFNDRNNVVHGVYLGLTMGVGEIDGDPAYMGGLKIAYVANRQFEVGFAGNFLYSEQDIYNNSLGRYEDLIGAYGGLHLEPIFFSKKRVNLSFPLLLGGGGVGYIDHRFHDDAVYEEELTEDDFDVVFVAEPGISALFNISRYLQLEAGLKYRFSSRIELPPTRTTRINGFSAGIGIKVGIFNMGRNRYKKNIQ
ncbi:hypothetical protein [Pseudozobellia thermophila]|uniref:Outer membrane protein beta-barrel domain-containing protein n=1 Tax=Pseudozobellia thermophila TaxID=192903 RepID=A0A1M6EV29_9FLAO|nr:hypothetical protein [Pseudozobellia thermophila]SHI89239.1 hypothetical protein SAMN04488513_102188 [Pseudozobellia thermophila]